MDVVYCSDDANAKAVAVSVRSLLNTNENVRVWIVADRWSEESRKFLASSIQPVEPVSTMDCALEGLPPAKDHISSATYIRLLIPTLFPHLTDCLYLDADTLVRAALRELEKEISREFPAAGVRDPETPKLGSATGIRFWKEDGLDPHADYVNAGVLWMNLKLWRAENLAQKCLAWIKKNPEAWGDNDAINANLSGRIQLLPLRYNATVHMMRPSSRVYGMEDTEEVDNARTNPAIVHFTGAIKPWHKNAQLPFLEEWRAVAESIGWRGYRHSFSWKRRVVKRVVGRLDSIN